MRGQLMDESTESALDPDLERVSEAAPTDAATEQSGSLQRGDGEIIAVAADFTTDLLPGRLSAEQRADLDRKGVIRLPTPYGPDPYPISRALLTEGEAHRVLTDDRDGRDGRDVLAGIRCPVRLVRGMCDPDIPWQRSVAVTERLTGTSAQLTLVNDGDHRLSRSQDLALIGAVLDALAATLGSAELGVPAAPEQEQEDDAKTEKDRGGWP